MVPERQRKDHHRSFEEILAESGPAGLDVFLDIVKDSDRKPVHSSELLVGSEGLPNSEVQSNVQTYLEGHHYPILTQPTLFGMSELALRRPVFDPVAVEAYIDRPCDTYEAYQALRAQLEAEGFSFKGNYFVNVKPSYCDHPAPRCHDAVDHRTRIGTQLREEIVRTTAFTTDGKLLGCGVGFFVREKPRA